MTLAQLYAELARLDESWPAIDQGELAAIIARIDTLTQEIDRGNDHPARSP